ncbi:Nn.00g037470.m01.CDS01 [Neocucurbitaria sp. VM-36]
MSYEDGVHSFHKRNEGIHEPARAAYTTYAPLHYQPLRFGPPLEIPVEYPDLHNHPFVRGATWSSGGSDTAIRKRKHADTDYACNDKRLRSDGLATGSRADPAFSNQWTQGTQHNPLEIESSPEPESQVKSEKRRAGLAKWEHAQLGDNILSRADIYVQPPSNRNKKSTYYAVAGGHVPGIYTDWHSVEEQIQGFSGALQKKFKSESEAWNYLEEHKDLVRISLCRQGERVGRPLRMPATPYASRSSRSVTLDRTWEWSPSGQHDSLPILTPPQPLDLEMLGAPPPYTLYDPVQSTSSETVQQRIAKDDFPADPEPKLSPEQQKVVDLIVQGHNVFYTGSAGCGKSTILKAFVKILHGRGQRVRIVAPTNLAALNVNGQTTWNFAGWTPDSMKKSLDKLMQAAHGKEVWDRFDTTDVLVIDEISMVENLLFERLNHIMKASRGEKFGGGPFGGVQIIVTGDFCQLSPVKPFQYCIGCGWQLIRDNQYRPKEYRCENRSCREDVFYDIDKWAFRSKAWKECDFKHINLTEIHRQHDKKFISILQRIRTDGVILPNHARILLNHPSETEDAIKLFSRRDDVDRVNNENISRLPSEARTYKCVDHFNWKEHHKDDRSLEKNTREADDGTGTLHALKEHRYEIFVQLKEGMRVVLQANLDPHAGLVNGSQGAIIGFEPYDSKKLPRKQENKNEPEMPGVYLLRGAHAKYAEQQIKIYAEQNRRQPWPIVKFDNGLTKTIYADCTANELGNEEPYSLLSRTQIPLMAGYAITVHKSQGMTLDRVIVDLARAFEPSQIYVALSRARSLQGLKVTSLPQRNLGGANAQVKEFFEKYLSKK